MTARELPVGMTVEMTRAILDGRKTETRRPVRDTEGDYPPSGATFTGINHCGPYSCFDYPEVSDLHWTARAPLGKPGDLLYVRERARVEAIVKHAGWIPAKYGLAVRYEADGATAIVALPDRIKRPKPGQCLANGCFKEAARIWLRVESVAVERVQDITEAGAHLEGWRFQNHPLDQAYDPVAMDTARRWFQSVWDSIYGSRDGLAYSCDPWVWVYRFSVVSTTGRAGVTE